MLMSLSHVNLQGRGRTGQRTGRGLSHMAEPGQEQDVIRRETRANNVTNGAP